MAYFDFTGIEVIGMASDVPSGVMDNAQMRDVFGAEIVDKIIAMTGVRQSRRTSEHQTASDLGVAAASRLLAHKGLDPKEIGVVVFASHSPDYRRPATACIIQHRLGIGREAVAIDVSLGCSALVYGLNVAASLLCGSDQRYALVITGDTAGKSVYPRDRSSALLFGEAGAAVLVAKTGNPAAHLRGLLRSDGSGWKYMIIPGEGYRNLHVSDHVFHCADGNPRTLKNSFIQGTSVFSFTIFDVPRLIRDFWQRTQTGPEDYDVFAFHQANLFILQKIAQKTRIPMERMPISLDRYGNTSGASAVVTLCDVYGHSAAEDPLRVLSCGFGIGLSWGIASFDVHPSDILPVEEDDTIFEEGIITDPDQLYNNI